jgi:hypothetical protein
MDDLTNTLNERDKRYGDFKKNADISIGILEIMQCSPNWQSLPSFMKKALITIADKISRILTGDPHYADNWHDIQGYAKLAEDRCYDEPMLTKPEVQKPTTFVFLSGVSIDNVNPDTVEHIDGEYFGNSGVVFKRDPLTGVAYEDGRKVRVEMDIRGLHD